MNTYSAQEYPDMEERPDPPSPFAPPPPDPDGQEQAVRKAEEEDEILSKFRIRFNRAKEHTREWRDEARQLYDMRAGHQWSAEDEARLREELRPIVTFNVADKYIDAVNGLQINNRQEISYFPRQPGDAKVNEELTGAVAYCRDQTFAVDQETDTFIDQVLIGLGWAEGFWDDENNPEGIAAKERRDPLEMYWDSDSRQRNLIDKKWVCRIRTMDVDEFESMFPEAEITAHVSSDLATVVTEFDSSDAGITIISNPQDYNPEFAARGSGENRGKVAVADYQYKDKQMLYKVRWQGGERKDLTKSECNALKKQLAANRMLYVETSYRRCVYWRCFIAGNKILRRVKLPWQDGFTYFAITGKRDRNKNLWYGIGRNLRDPQMWVNKFFSQILHVINTNAKGGAFYESDAFADQRKAESDWARPDALIEVKSGALAEGRIVPRTPPVYPEGMDRLMQFSLTMLPQVSGLNPEIIGLADRDQPGVLEAQRKQAAMAIIAWCFDSMRMHYKQAGKWYAAMVRDFMSDGRLVLINGREGSKYIRLLRDRLVFEYDVIVDESPTSTNAKERVWSILQPLLPVLGQYGIAPPKEVLDYMPLPTDVIEAWKKQMAPNPEKEQMQKQNAMLDLQGKEADAKQKSADADYKKAQSAKIMSEIGRPDAPNTDMAQMVMEAKVEERLVQLKASIDGRLEAMRQERDANTKLQIEEMRNNSAENIAALNASVQMMGKQAEADDEEEAPAEEPEPIEPDPVLETLNQIAENLKALRAPRRFVYDDTGELAGVE